MWVDWLTMIEHVTVATPKWAVCKLGKKNGLKGGPSGIHRENKIW